MLDQLLVRQVRRRVEASGLPFIICRKPDLQPDEQLLDIGCGWGGLILHAAKRYAVRAVGITLSDDQHAYVSEQIEARGLAGRVEAV